MLKLIHNKSIPKYFLALVGLVIAGYFALNAYPVSEWAGQRFLQTTPDGPQTLGVVCAAFMGICVIILFFYKEYMRETVSAYSLAKGDYSFERAFKWFVWFVMGLEFCSVAFRWMLLNGSAFGFVLLCLGLVGMEERIALTGGSLELRSAPGQGTHLLATFPLPPAGKEPAQ